jgi:molybdopterin molybdotransferase
VRSSDYPMIPASEAWERIAAVLRPLPPATVPLSQAHGLIPAEEVVARESIPPFAASAMDGYAVIAADSAPERRVVAQQEAGATDAPALSPGTAVRIMTGAPLPPGADAVVPFEEADERDGTVYLRGPVRAGQNVRPPGQDIAAGDSVLSPGARLGPAEIGLLASLGQVTVRAHPRPRVAFFTTGSELVPAEAVPGPGQIRDSNGPALAAAITEAGCTPVPLGSVADDPEALRAAILDGTKRADMLLTSGGVSMGVKDLIKPLLAELGTIHFGRVAIKPGKPLTFALVDGVPVFGLPGFPVSSLVCFENFVRPALRLMAGHSRLWRPEVPVRSTHDIRHDSERTEYVRAVVARREGVLWATTTGSQVSGRLKSLVGANALLRLPPSPEDVYAGDEVTAILIDQPEVT